jgi:hypothetical protein
VALRYGFHSTDLSNSIKHAFHALALDEHRGPFKPTLWQKTPNSSTTLKQVWFPGVHTNIGGGYNDQELADITLIWMIQQLQQLKSGPLEFLDEYLDHIIRNNRIDSNYEWAAGHIETKVDPAMRPFSGYYRKPKEYGDGMEETIHSSVRIRMEVVPGWTSGALKGWTWNKETKFWEKGKLKIGEEKLGELEKRFAGEAARRDMIRD